MSEDTSRHVREAKGGSEAAFAALFERAYPVLEVWARVRITGTLARYVDPDDLIQEVWWTALQRFADFDPDRGHFRAWLIGIASNVLRTLRRKRAGMKDQGRAGQHVDLTDLGDELQQQWTSLTRAARRSENGERLTALVQQFDATDQRIFIHRGLEGLPLRDVGMLLDISENAAKKRWAKLRERLSTLSVWSDLEAELD